MGPAIRQLPLGRRRPPPLRRVGRRRVGPANHRRVTDTFTQREERAHMPNGMTMAGPLTMIFMLIVMVLVLGALVAGIVWLVRTLSDDRRSPGSHALHTLEERYARGEIDRDEYFQRRNDLDPRG